MHTKARSNLRNSLGAVDEKKLTPKIASVVISTVSANILVKLRTLTWTCSDVGKQSNLNCLHFILVFG